MANVFLPRDGAQREQVRRVIDGVIAEEGQYLLGWRPVPTSDRALGESAAAVMPVIEQLFIGWGGEPRELTVDPMRLERKLYVMRKRVERAVEMADTDVKARVDPASTQQEPEDGEHPPEYE